MRGERCKLEKDWSPLISHWLGIPRATEHVTCVNALGGWVQGINIGESADKESKGLPCSAGTKKQGAASKQVATTTPNLGCVLCQCNMWNAERIHDDYDSGLRANCSLSAMAEILVGSDCDGLPSCVLASKLRSVRNGYGAAATGC